jgi:signal transduction histidine kinase
MHDAPQLLTLLVVEDNPADLFVLEGLLWKTRLLIDKILRASSFAETVLLLENNKPNLILLDLSLTDSIGIDSFAHINQIASGIPIIVLTGLADREMALETMASGAQDYLVKGEFDEKLLAKSIQYSIERKKNLENILSTRMAMEQKLEEQRILKQKEIAEAVIIAQEKERHDLSRELHDNVNQQLTVAMMYIASAEKKQEGGSEILKQSANFIFNAIEEIRKLTKNLVTPLIKDFGLVKAIDSIVEDVSALNTIHIQFNAESFFENDIQYDFKLSIFRIIQEQMSNVLKHAQASNCSIELGRNDELIYLTVMDDGIGFDLNTQKSGIGIYNINSRVELFNGSINILTAPTSGCTMRINFPLSASLLLQ